MRPRFSAKCHSSGGTVGPRIPARALSFAMKRSFPFSPVAASRAPSLRRGTAAERAVGIWDCDRWPSESAAGPPEAFPAEVRPAIRVRLQPS